MWCRRGECTEEDASEGAHADSRESTESSFLQATQRILTDTAHLHSTGEEIKEDTQDRDRERNKRRDKKHRYESSVRILQIALLYEREIFWCSSPSYTLHSSIDHTRNYNKF